MIAHPGIPEECACRERTVDSWLILGELEVGVNEFGVVNLERMVR